MFANVKVSRFNCLLRQQVLAPRYDTGKQRQCQQGPSPRRKYWNRDEQTNPANKTPTATSELNDANAANLHHALHMDKSKSTIDLMSVITTFKTSVETKFSTISDTMMAMQNSLSGCAREDT